MARDVLHHKLWDHYLHLVGLCTSSDPSLSRSSSKGKDQALSISFDNEKQNTDDDDGNNDDNHWPGIGSSEDNNEDAGVGGANTGAMNTS